MLCYFYDKILTVENVILPVKALRCLSSASFNKYLFATSLTWFLFTCKCIKIVLIIMHLYQYFTVYC